MRHPGGAIADCVGDVCGYEHSAQRDHHDRQQPQIPRHHETSEFIERELGPLVNTALERHYAAQINHHDALWNVEEHNRQQPEEQMRLAELRCGADPARTDDEKNLRENEIAQSQRLFEGGALLFNVAFCAIERSLHR